MTNTFLNMTVVYMPMAHNHKKKYMLNARAKIFRSYLSPDCMNWYIFFKYPEESRIYFKFLVC